MTNKDFSEKLSEVCNDSEFENKIKAKKRKKAIKTAVFAGVFLLVIGSVFLFKSLYDRNQKTDLPDNGTFYPENNRWATKLNAVTVSKVTNDMTEIGFDEKLINYVSEHTEGNYMLSPLSFRYALGLLAAGAEGETKAELLKAFGTENLDEWVQYCRTFNGFVERFEEADAAAQKKYDEGVEKGWYEASDRPVRALRIANSVWKNSEITSSFKTAYSDYIETNFGAEYRTFGTADGARLINEWASIKTEKMIEKLLPDDYNMEDIAVVLMNALYFKDNWVNAFKEYYTKADDFTTKAGTKVSKQFMNGIFDNVKYYKDDSTEILVLPMEYGVNMAFVIGDRNGISEKINKAESRNVNVTIPKIDMETTFSNSEFVDFLIANGVTKAFTADADFSGMTDERLFVSDIIQKTKIKLDETGVEAAAVTIIPMELASIITDEPTVFRADRPFSFYIYATANDSSAIMFAGEIVE